MNKPWLVIFEGIDKSGKSSIINEFRKLTNYRHTVIDRAFISSAVYNIKFDRKDSSIDYLLQLVEISKIVNTLIVICTADVDCIIKRARLSSKFDYINKENNEELSKEIQRDNNLFLAFSKIGKYHTLILDTTDQRADEQALFISKYINELDRTGEIIR